MIIMRSVMDYNGPMKAVTFEQFGTPANVLRVGELASPQPGPGEVRVRMRFAPVNPSDIMTIRGKYGRLPKLPATPGFEGMGVIDAVGPGFLAKFRRLKLGRRVGVIAAAGGSWAQEIVVSARNVIPLADDISDEQAASFFVNPATVIAMVNKVLQVPRDAWLLQTAAGSALGRMIIRLGKQQGFRTLNLVRRSDAIAELKSLGANEVLSTADGNAQERILAITGGKGVPFALDCVGGETGHEAIKALAAGGHALLFGSLSGEAIPLDPRDLITGSKTLSGFWLSDWAKKQHPLTMLGLFRQIAQLIRDGIFRTQIAGTYGMEQISAAAAAAEEPGRPGKILLRLS